MGCVLEAETNPLIPPPEGTPDDPLERPGDIIENIVLDPHINYYHAKIEQVLMPIARKKLILKKSSQIEQFATADKKEH